MKCPIDDTALQMMERQGIEIDYCPTCRGIWLDRGELDKIIERDSASQGGERRSEGRGRVEENERSGLLENIFDFI